MIEIILLAAILVSQLAIVWAIFELKWSFEAWTEVWGKSPLPASDYHAKEVWKTLQEIAHMMAVDRLQREARRTTEEMDTDFP
jgi:hypothetical protein